MKWLAPVFLILVVPPAHAESLWVQATASGYEARIATVAAACPALSTDAGEVAMTVRAAALHRLPAQRRGGAVA